MNKIGGFGAQIQAVNKIQFSHLNTNLENKSTLKQLMKHNRLAKIKQRDHPKESTEQNTEHNDPKEWGAQAIKYTGEMEVIEHRWNTWH